MLLSIISPDDKRLNVIRAALFHAAGRSVRYDRVPGSVGHELYKIDSSPSRFI
jgi:hypothetical protein